MNEKIVFVRTSSGEDEVRSRTAHLSKDIKRALVMVDGTSSVAEIMKRSSPSLRGMLEDMFTELARGGYIQDKAKAGRPAPSKPQSPAPVSAIKKPAEEIDELDFTAAFRVPTQAMLDAEGARQAEQARNAERQARLKAEQDAIMARERAETERRAQELADAKAEHAKAEAMARAAAQEKANLEAEVAKLKAQAEAEARARAEAEKLARQVAAKAQAKLVAEAARLKADQEAAVRAAAEQRAKEVLEAARLAEQRAAEVKAEADARARAVAEEKAKLEAEMARLKAHAEEQARARSEAEKLAQQAADAARMQAEQLAREAAARLKAEQEAAARAEAERHAQEVLEAGRLAEQHAAEVKAEAEARARAVAEEKARLEAEVAKLKELAEAEAGARLEANEQAKREAEAARIKAEQEAARAREEMAMEKARAAAEAAAREEAERIARQAEAARIQAEQEAERVRAEAARIQAEQEAEKARAEAERIKAEQEAEKARAEAERIKAEQEAERARVEAERIKAEQDAEKARTEAERIKAEQAAERARAEAERIKVEQEAESARAEAERIKAEQEVERARAEAERIRIEQEAESARAEAERIKAERDAEKARAEAAAPAVATVRDPSQWVTRSDSAGAPLVDRRKTAPAVAGCDPRGGNNGVPIVERRTTTAAVVFFDIVGYTKQPDRRQIELKQQFSQLLADSLDPLEAGERIILDTGDGAAIGFLQHPTDALQTAMHFREGLLSNKYHDALRVRIGIHLGPVSLVKDMNGQTNMLGDGINSAQRVMSFAGLDQIYVSRSYFEFISNLSDEYDELFRYLGGKQDKHGREHKVYELLSHPDEAAQVQAPEAAPAESPISFNFDAFDAALLQAETQPANVAGQLLKDTVGLAAESVAEPVPEFKPELIHVAAEPAPVESVPAEPAPAEPVVETQPKQSEYSEEEARQLADAQAKKWAEAEQRAAELARRQAETIPQQIFQQTVAEAPAPAPAPAEKPPVRRKPLPIGKILAGVFVLLLAALFIVPALLPMQGYRTGIEQQLGAKLQQPVHIGQLSGRLLPTPALVLTDVSIGDAKRIKAQQAKLNFGFSALFSAVKTIDRLRLDGVNVDGAVLPAAALWLQQIAGDSRYPLARIELAHGKIESDGVGFSDVDGEFDFAANGQFAQAKLSANAHKLALEMHATPEQKLQLSVTLRDTALPSLPNWVFDDLKATGELSRDELRISDFDGRIMGGVLTGEARINWRAGWRVQGSLEAKVIPLENISKLLNGDLDGSAHFQMQSESLAKLADAAILNGVFSVKKGFISGVDVVETARLRSRDGVPGGRTHFDVLNGELLYANDSYQFRQLNINDSVMKAVGSLTISHQKLAGNFSADLSMRAGMGSVPLQVDGTIESPSLHAR